MKLAELKPDTVYAVSGAYNHTSYYKTPLDPDLMVIMVEKRTYSRNSVKRRHARMYPIMVPSEGKIQVKDRLDTVNSASIVHEVGSLQNLVDLLNAARENDRRLADKAEADRRTVEQVAERLVELGIPAQASPNRWGTGTCLALDAEAAEKLVIYLDNLLA
jgi:hypothetical protein